VLKGTLRGCSRGRLGSEGSGNGRVRGRPRRFGSTQGGGATLYQLPSKRKADDLRSNTGR